MIHILQGDCRTVLARLPGGSVHSVVTSPPYFGLRDYGVEGQLGLEASPDAYVAELVEVFRAVRRVLRDDGTVWLVIGDSYANDAKWGGSSGGKHVTALHGNTGIGRGRRQTGAKPKDLLMIPARVALALQADGWTLRSDIIWAKPSCMPESVTDRPSNAHEHVFLLSKAARYFYDAEAIAEPAELEGVRSHRARYTAKYERGGDGGAQHSSKSNLRTAKETRNARNVWTITSQPYSGAHFAVMPAELAERCIRAGTPEHGVCGTCGTPWQRIAHRGQSDYARLGKVKKTRDDSTPTGAGHTRNANGVVPSLRPRSVIATDWRRGCRCHNAGRERATVLDPFAGAFTTALAADRLGRNAIGIELNERYCRMARERLQDDAGLFAALTEHEIAVAQVEPQASLPGLLPP